MRQEDFLALKSCRWLEPNGEKHKHKSLKNDSINEMIIIDI